MNLVASSFGGTALWLVLGAVLVVVLGGVVALTAALLHVVRSVSLSARELGELRDVLAQRQVTQQSPAGAAAGPSSAGEPTGEPRLPDGGEEKDGERGGTTEG
jgi:hypothetical protein